MNQDDEVLRSILGALWLGLLFCSEPRENLRLRRAASVSCYSSPSSSSSSPFSRARGAPTPRGKGSRAPTSGFWATRGRPLPCGGLAGRSARRGCRRIAARVRAVRVPGWRAAAAAAACCLGAFESTAAARERKVRCRDGSEAISRRRRGRGGGRGAAASAAWPAGGGRG